MMQSVLKLNPFKSWFTGSAQDEALPVQLGARRSDHRLPIERKAEA